MLLPKRVKYRKQQRGRMGGAAFRGSEISFGEFGLQSLDQGWISGRQIEAGRIGATHFLGGEGKLYIRLFPRKPITAIPLETRMGKGKGEPEYWAAVVRPGTMLYEIGGVTEQVAKEVLSRIAHKMPVKTRMVKRRTH